MGWTLTCSMALFAGCSTERSRTASRRGELLWSFGRSRCGTRMRIAKRTRTIVYQANLDTLCLIHWQAWWRPRRRTGRKACGAPLLLWDLLHITPPDTSWDAGLLGLQKAPMLPPSSKTWRAMLAYALGNAGWSGKKRRFDGERLLRQLLGFGSGQALAGSFDGRPLVMHAHDFYRQWAKEHLIIDEDNIAGLCG